MLHKTCDKYNVDYLCSAFDLKSLNFYIKIQVSIIIKLHQVKLFIDCLEFLSKKTPIILSTGMDIKKSLEVLNKYKKRNNNTSLCK